MLKVAKSQNVFHFVSNLPKKVSNHSPEHYPPKEKILRGVIWYLFWKIWAKVKNNSEIKPPLVLPNT